MYILVHIIFLNWFLKLTDEIELHFQRSLSQAARWKILKEDDNKVSYRILFMQSCTYVANLYVYQVCWDIFNRNSGYIILWPNAYAKTRHLYIRLTFSHLKGSGKKQRKNVKKLSCRWGFEPRATGFSHQCSNHWATTTLDFQDSHIFSFILLSSTACCSLVLNRPPIITIRTPFRCQRETPPPPERSHNLWIKKGFNSTI